MSWKRWKLGLFVALLTGCLDACVVLVADPSMTSKALIFLFLYWIGKDGVLYLTKHPIETVSLGDGNTQIITKDDIKNEKVP